MKKKKIVILGGLGFIGRNLYSLLARGDHEVIILTNRIYGAGIVNDIPADRIVTGSILDKPLLDDVLKGTDAIFSLAGSSGASGSIKDPYHDLDTNLRGHLNILEACRNVSPTPLLILPSTRLVYGKPRAIPVSEDHPLQPESIYAIHKLTTEHYYLLYHRLYGLRCVIFRISNPYGPYQRFETNNYGVLNWFIHKAIQGEPIRLYGDGSQRRDFFFIEDLTRLMAEAMDAPGMWGKIFNVGYGEGISLADAVAIVRKRIPGTRVIREDWPAIERQIETGDYISDIRRLKSTVGWAPVVTPEEGINKTIDFYERSR